MTSADMVEHSEQTRADDVITNFCHYVLFFAPLLYELATVSEPNPGIHEPDPV